MSSIGTSSFELMFLRQPTLPTDILFGPKSEIERDRKEFLVEQTARMRSAYDTALAVQSKTDKRKKAYYDSKHVDVEYEKGDLVWLYTPKIKAGLAKKLSPKNSGPFEITEKHSPVLYSLKASDGSIQKAHAQRLIPCYLAPGARWENIEIRQADNYSEDDQIQDFDRPAPPLLQQNHDTNFSILRKRVSAETNGNEYLVRDGVNQFWCDEDFLPPELLAAFSSNARSQRAKRRQAA